jgi:hypothetical protein
MAADRVAGCPVGQLRPAETLMLVLPTLCAAPYRGPLNLALQLPYLKISESMGNHDSKIVDTASVD